jgi:hypothetical protein
MLKLVSSIVLRVRTQIDVHISLGIVLFLLELTRQGAYDGFPRIIYPQSPPVRSCNLSFLHSSAAHLFLSNRKSFPYFEAIVLYIFW